MQFRNGQRGLYYAIDFLNFMHYSKKSFRDSNILMLRGATRGIRVSYEAVKIGE